MENNELLKIFIESKNVTDLLKKLKLSDNTPNRNKVKDISVEINFDLNLYRKPKKFCLNCGKQLKKGQKKFCCRSCSGKTTNIGKKMTEETKEKIRIKLTKNKIVKTEKKVRKKRVIKTIKIKKEKNKAYCKNCGKEIRYNKIFCDVKCIGEHKHKESYLYFLNNHEEYSNGGYTPKGFKDFFLNEQDGKCAICGINQEWNGNKLVFIIDHIDGDASNNKRENIRMICPNCDSQTNTFKSKNKNSKRRNYWKEKIIRDINNKSN